MITDRLQDLVLQALETLQQEGVLTVETPPVVEFERPRRREHGDWSTNVALAVAGGKALPREIAAALVERLSASDLLERAEVAGPGFVNFHLTPKWLHDVVRLACDPGSNFGRSNVGAGTSVNVEYVSANPTGPISVVSGRHAAVGDAISNLLAAIGHSVTREFYVNDAGRQIELFGRSIQARLQELKGAEAQIPEGGYAGQYVLDLARRIATEQPELASPESKDLSTITELGVGMMLQAMKSSLERFGTSFDLWRSERDLHQAGAVRGVVERLRSAGLAFEGEGATWFAASRFGDDKDRVLTRATGETTYLASDAAYLVDKFNRAFDGLIYLWGADHHGTVARLVGMAEALGFNREAVEVLLVQIVTLSEGGKALKGSKRAGVIVELDQLVDEVGVDAARYTFLSRSIDAHLDFDIELVKQQAPENPVYYVQYAHARISSILRKATEEGFSTDPATADLARLTHDSEIELMRKLASFEELVLWAAQRRAPHRVAGYLEELAAAFSAFYRDCRVMSEDVGLSDARLSLCIATRRTIADGLGLLGVGAPERM
ncbi:MAG: arginine--tRNA ligase [Actinomycetota bacterium]